VIARRRPTFLRGAWLVGVWAVAAAATASVDPPPSLELEGVPAISPELARGVTRYQNFRSAAFAGWHPTRREMLIGTRFADTVQVHQVTTPLGARRQLTFFPDRCTAIGFDPRPGRESLLLSMDEGGSENFQLYRFDLASGGTTLLTDGKSRNTAAAIHRRTGMVAYSTTRRNGRDWDIHVIDPRDPASDRTLYEATGAFSVADWSPDGKGLLVVESVSIAESHLYLLDVASGRIEPLTPGDAEPAFFGSARFTQEGGGLFLVSDREHEFRTLFRMNLGTRRMTPLTPSLPWDVGDLALSHDGRTLAFVANENGSGVLHLLDTASGTERTRPQTPPGQVGGLGFHPSRAELAFRVESARSPGDVYSLDVETRTLTRWTESEVGPIDAARIPEPRQVRVPTFDQAGGRPREIAALLSLPGEPYRPPFPVVIEIHGGPEGQARSGFEGRDNYLVMEMGIAQLRPNVRGSTGYGKTFAALDNGRLREDSVKDIGALLDWIATRPDLDAKRVCVMGGSYGGYMSLASMVHFSARLRCGIDVVGISDFVTFLESTSEYRRALRRVEYGDERDPEMRTFLKSISPLSQVERIAVPMLVVQGANDPRVPRTEAEQVVRSVRERGKTVWYVLGKDEGHGFAKKANADYLQLATLRFLEEFLLK